METRQLGKDGPWVPILCFGTWPISGAMGEVPRSQAEATVHAALDLGMTFIDTAEGYFDSEAIVGRVVKGRRDRVFLATKLSGDQSHGHMAEAVEASLKALDTDYLDLYQLHRPKPQWPIQQTMENLVRLRDEGKIRYIGLSNFNAEETAEAMQYGPVLSSQPLYNMLQRRAGDSLLPFCLEKRIGVLPYSPLGKGLLTGRYKPGHRFPPDDIRGEDRINVWSGENAERIFEVTERLKAWAEDHGRDIVQLAVAWTLAHPAVTSTIVGARNPEQLHHSAKAAGWKLTEEELRELDEVQGDLRLPHEVW